MALLSAYATAAEYRSRVNKTDTADDADILAQITGVSRALEFELNVAPGAFNAGAASETRYFTPLLSNSSQMRLVDEAGRQHLVTTIDSNGIGVDLDGDGVYEYTIDPSGESWVVARPYNAGATLGEPYNALELLPLLGASFTRWPSLPRSVKVTGTWGWPAVPGMIKELCVKRCRDIRDSEEAGAAGSLSGAVFRTDTWRLWIEVKNQYGYALSGLT